MDKDQLIEEIINKLHEVYDPEIPVNIYDLGMVYNVDVDEENNAKIIMTLTSPNCPAVDMILADVESQAKSIDGINGAVVEITFDPPWDKSMMSEEARLELGFF